MAKTPKKQRNRAAQDATLVNIRALKRRVQELERFRRAHMDRIIDLEARVLRAERALVWRLTAAKREALRVEIGTRGEKG